LFGAVFLIFNMAISVKAEDVETKLHGQFMFGKWALAKESDNVEGGDYDLPLVGLAVQKQVNQGRLELGIETGALLSIRGDTRVVSVSGGGSGGSVKVAYDNKLFVFDYFGGVYIGGRPVERLRLYAGCGPLIIYGSREIEPEPDAPPEAETETDAGISVGLYGRAGIELIIMERFILGAGVRGIASGLKLESTIGSTRMEGLQYLVSIAFKF
jgi:hypothetical protein